MASIFPVGHKVTPFVDFIRANCPYRSKWSYKDVLQDLNWYLHRGTAIMLQKETGEKSVFLCRFIFSEEEGIKKDVHFPLGNIVWCDYFISNDVELTINTVTIAIEKWKAKNKLAYQRRDKIMYAMEPMDVLRMYRLFVQQLKRKQEK